MSLATGGPEGGVRAEINITPLVDVCLVILIIMMVVTPYLVDGPGVQMPAARSGAAQPDGDHAVTVAMDATGRLYLGERPVEAAALASGLTRSRREQASKPLRFQGDRRLTFGEIKGVLREVREAGYPDAALLVQPVDSEGRPLAEASATGALPEGGGR